MITLKYKVGDDVYKVSIGTTVPFPVPVTKIYYSNGTNGESYFKIEKPDGKYINLRFKKVALRTIEEILLNMVDVEELIDGLMKAFENRDNAPEILKNLYGIFEGVWYRYMKDNFFSTREVRDYISDATKELVDFLIHVGENPNGVLEVEISRMTPYQFLGKYARKFRRDAS